MVAPCPLVSSEGFRQQQYAPPPEATELVLVRHGASAVAIAGTPFPLFEGQGNPELAPEGREQAERVAARLAREPFTGLYVSPFARTVQTAEPIAAACGLEPTTIPELREVHTGELEGGAFRIAVAEGDPRIAQLFVEERWDVIPGAEPMEAFAERVRSAAAAVVGTAGPGSAIVVTHGAFIAELCRQAAGSRPFAFITVDNGSITRLVYAGGRQILRSFNDTAHLVE
jgi:probable phosphoglycerate mutase